MQPYRFHGKSLIARPYFGPLLLLKHRIAERVNPFVVCKWQFEAPVA